MGRQFGNDLGTRSQPVGVLVLPHSVGDIGGRDEPAHSPLGTFCALAGNTLVVALATYGAWNLAGLVIEALSR